MTETKDDVSFFVSTLPVLGDLRCPSLPQQVAIEPSVSSPMSRTSVFTEAFSHPGCVERLSNISPHAPENDHILICTDNKTPATCIYMSPRRRSAHAYSPSERRAFPVIRTAAASRCSEGSCLSCPALCWTITVRNTAAGCVYFSPCVVPS